MAELSHLDQLEAEAIYIIREVAARAIIWFRPVSSHSVLMQPFNIWKDEKDI